MDHVHHRHNQPSDRWSKGNRIPLEKFGSRVVPTGNRGTPTPSTIFQFHKELFVYMYNITTTLFHLSTSSYELVEISNISML